MKTIVAILNKKHSKNRSEPGFLLIEMVAALAILGIFLFSITHSFSRVIQWQQEALLQLRALNAATLILETVIEQQRLPALLQRTIDGCTVTVAQEKITVQSDDLVCVSQKMISDIDKAKNNFKAISITAAWNCPSGQKRSLQILTGIMVQNYE